MIQTARPVALPRVRDERLFLGSACIGVGRGDVSHVCTPLRSGPRVTGALGISLPALEAADLRRRAELFERVAGLLGRALEAHRVAQVERDRLLDENRELRRLLGDHYGLRNVVGNSAAMREVFRQLSEVAATDAPVLLRGEPGTGKETIAHALHYASPRAAQPFVELRCGSLPESQIELELFGCEPGGFPGQRFRRSGRLERAHGGTLYLPGILELGRAAQARLLRFLVDSEVERLGGLEPVRVNARLVVASEGDLERAVSEKRFDEELLGRLEASSVWLPPLRSRRADVPVLVGHFLARCAAAQGRSVKRVATSAIDALLSYHWPGNVRELEDCVEQGVLACDEGVLHAHHLPPTLQTPESSGTLPERSLGEAVEAFERDLLLDALKSARGSRARAARMLSATQRIVGYKIRKYGIDCERFKVPRSGRR